jgi:hypothetical protein
LQVIDLERADALGHKAIEAANALQLVSVHSLTLVRYLLISSALAPAGRFDRPASWQRHKARRHARSPRATL